MEDTLLNRMSGIIMILFLLAAMFIYGFSGEVFPENSLFTTANLGNIWATEIMSLGYFGTAIFVVIGFGMVLSYYNKGSMMGFYVASLVASITIVISPILMKFWYNVFIGGFSSNVITTAADTNQGLAIYTAYLSRQRVELSLFSERVALVNTLSQLVAYLACMGKMSIPSVIINSVIYNIFWNLTYMLDISIVRRSTIPNVFDEFSIANVYVFGTMVTIAQAITLKRVPNYCEENHHSEFSGIIALIGSFFLYCTFGLTANPNFLNAFNIMLDYQNILWALSAGVLGTCFTAYLIPCRLTIRNFIFGNILGGVATGAMTQIFTNVLAPVVIGFASGFFSVIYFEYLDNKINKVNLFDSFGGIIYAIIAILCTFVLAPLSYVGYANRNNISTRDWINFSLAFTGITIGIGFCTGLLTGGFGYCMAEYENKYLDDMLYISHDLGLYKDRKQSHLQPESSHQLRA